MHPVPTNHTNNPAPSPALAGKHASVFLVGMMGAGKTTIGRLLARRHLQCDFIDLDRALEERCGVRIAHIFEVEGEAGFRRRETHILDEYTQRRSVVLSTGGGAVLAAENRQYLRNRGLVVYLRTEAEELYRRLARDHKRPLLQVPDVKAHIQNLLHQREPLYTETAHITFDTGTLSAVQVARALHATLQHTDSFA